IGQREALRLFLELSCFANARSYTVWPRASERDTTIEAARDVAKGGIADLWSGVVNAQMSAETARRRDLDHIFGIGDWGVLADDGRPGHCAPELMTILAEYPVEMNFVDWLKQGKLSDPDFSGWWQGAVIAECEELKRSQKFKSIGQIAEVEERGLRQHATP